MSNKDISQTALFKGVNLNKAASKNSNKTMIQTYKNREVSLKSKRATTR